MSGTSPIFGGARLRRERIEPEREHGWIAAPAEGWIALIALLAMVLTAAAAIDGAAWAGLTPDGRASQTGFLPIAGLLSVLLGTALAKSRLGVLRAHLVGAVGGGLYLIVAISGSISVLPDLTARLRALNTSVATWLGDVLILGIRSAETSVFLLVLGALLWAAGHFAAFAVFRRQRPLPAITLVGLILLLNVSVTASDQYVHLIVFCAAALVLLVRLRLVEKVEEWRARGMGDLSDISTAFMRGGAIFVAALVIGSTTLAANGRSNALAPAWRDIDDRLIEFGYEVNRWLGGVSGETRGPNVLLSPTQTIRDFWEASDDVAFTTASDDPTGFYWRGASYDAFDGRTWQQTDRHATAVSAGDYLLAEAVDAPEDGARRRPVTVTITPRGLGGSLFVAPEGIVSIDQPAEVLTHGPAGPLIGGRLSEGIREDVPYTVTAAVPEIEGENAPTGNELAAAGVEYPPWAERYVEIREGSLSPLAYATARSILNSLALSQRDPYNIVRATQKYLFSNGGFRYAIDIRGLCGASDVVDCFLRIKAGYCEQFATAMTMLLRVHQIPARYVVGFLPGTLKPDGTREVTRAAAHAWVEVYFPGYGWIRFDPTPGNQAQGQTPTDLPDGDPIGTPRPNDYNPPTPNFGNEDEDLGPDRNPVTPPAPRSGGGSQDVLAFALLAIVLLAVGLFVVAGLIRRAPAAQPEIVYGGVTRLARRLGHGPRPAQTAFEFADGLGVLVPPVRADLRLIAAAKVEATYAGRPVDGSVLAGLLRAYRRVRVGLLRLVVRRPRWLRRPGGLRGPRASH